MRIVPTALVAESSLVSRRSLMLGVAALPLAAGACASLDPAEIDRKLKRVAADAKVIAAGLKSVLAQLSALDIPGLTPKVIEVAGTAIAGITQVADALQGVTTLAAAQPLVEKISTYVQAVAGALAALPLPKEVTTALRAAQILAPALEMLVGLAVNRVAEGSEIEQGRAVLQAVARDVLARQ